MQTLAELPHTLRFPIQDASHIADARRRAEALVRYARLSTSDRGRLALIITELATNILKHAGQGWILIQSVKADHVFDASLGLIEPTGGRLGIDVIAIDKGPGMSDPAACLADGYSTAGSSGTGLGAIMRQANGFDIYTNVKSTNTPRGTIGNGTTVIARVMRDTVAFQPEMRAQVIGVAGINVPHEFEDVSGDNWTCKAMNGGINIMVADGIGHGPDAHLASRTAVDAFQDSRADTPTVVMDSVHDKLVGTRGAAVSVARWDIAESKIVFCGIGNVAASVTMDASTGVHAPSHSRKLMTYNGTVGQNIGKGHKDLSYQIPRESILILHSDGISTSWNLDHYPGLAAKPPALIAAVLYRDYSRGRDDASIVVAKFIEE